MGNELFGSVEQALASTPLPDAQVQAEPQSATQTESSEPQETQEPEGGEPTGTSLDQPVQDAELEKLRKQLLGDYTRKTQEIAPLRRLLQEQGVTLDRIQSALQLETAFREHPAEFLRTLQAFITSQETPSPSSQMPQTTQTTVPTILPQMPQFDSVVSAIEETYGKELAEPFKQINQVNQLLQQKILQLEQQLNQDREFRQKETIKKAVEQAESSLSNWIERNKHFNLTADQIKQLRREVSQMLGGPQGLVNGVSDRDFEAAVLRILGPDKYRDVIYNQRLKTEREKVEKTVPGPVVTPGPPTGTPIMNELDIRDSQKVLDEAMNLIAHWQRTGLPSM